VVPTPPVAPTGVTITQEEFDSLNSRAQNFDVINGDDKAMSMLRQHYNGETLNQPDPDPSTPPDNSDYGKQIAALGERMDRMSSVGDSIQEQLATIVISDFAKGNPEFEANRARVGELIGQHPGMPLDQALTLAKAERGTREPAPDGQLKPAPVQASAETVSAGEIPGSGDPLRDAEARISDTKEVPDFGRAIELAVDAAKAHHGVG
jgi:hypothetical protein